MKEFENVVGTFYLIKRLHNVKLFAYTLVHLSVWLSMMCLGEPSIQSTAEVYIRCRISVGPATKQKLIFCYVIDILKLVKISGMS